MNRLTLSNPRRIHAKHSILIWIISLSLLLITASAGARLLPALNSSARVPVTPTRALSPSGKQNPPPCCGSDDTKPHTLVGSYYTVKGNLSSKLLLNNKGPRPLEARPTLFSMSGERFEAPPVTIDPESFRMMDIRDWVQVAGPQFKQGSVEVFHLGRDLVLGSQIYILDEEHSLSFDEKLGEVSAFKSTRLEGVWWQPTHAGDVQLALSNTTNAPVTVTVKASGHTPERTGYEVVQLASRQTRLLDVQEDLMHHEHGAMSKFGGISVEHSGPIGAVLARGMVLNPETGYSLAIQFSDPAAAKSTNVQGVGLRLGKVGGEALRPIAVFRNVGSSETVITEKLPYTRENGNSSVVNLPTIHLGAGEMEVVDIGRWLDDHGHGQLKGTGGLETFYTGEKGNVIISALSVTNDGNKLFRVPMWDVAAQRSSTGGYPWYIEGHSSTTAYIKNAENYEQHYYLQLTYPGGVYSMGIKAIAAGKVVVFDLRKLRDEQVPDARGNLIPLTASSGQMQWSSIGPERGMILGRSEQADNNLGYSSNYACMNCCTNNAGQSRVLEDTTLDVGASHTFVAQMTSRNCNGGQSAFMDVPYVNWSSSNLAVASVDSDGRAYAQGPGEADIMASWDADHYSFGNDDPPGTWFIEPIGGMGSCSVTGYDPQRPKATLTVRPTVSKIQYQRGNDFIDTTDPQYVLKGTSVTFKAIPNPENATWPSGKPTWGGSAGASGTGATKTITFNTLSSSTNDLKTVTASNGNTVNVNIVVYDIDLIRTPENNFSGRSLERFGIEESISLGVILRPSVTVSQVGGLRWSIVTTGSGVGTLSDVLDDGTAIYVAPDTAHSIVLSIKILEGPCKDSGYSTSFAIVEPTGGNIYRLGTATKHQINTWSTGFLGVIHITPDDVSFRNLLFYEGAAPVSLSGWLATNQFNIPHAQTTNPPPIDSHNDVLYEDRIYTGQKESPFGIGYWYWDIPWHVITHSGRNIGIGTFRQLATSDDNGTAVISKGGRTVSSNAGADTRNDW